MMKIMRNKILLLLISISLGLQGTCAQEFFSTEEAPVFFNLGARIGFNTSNRTFPSGYFNEWNDNSWGTGFNIGAIANLNFKDYLSLQPGIFFESRSGNYSYFTSYYDWYNKEQIHYELGHRRSYYITVPIMGIVKFNLSSQIKWLVELGPYIQFNLKDSGQNNVYVLYRPVQSSFYDYYVAEHNSFDAGLKIGTAIKVMEHYYLGIHYLAGFCKAWEKPQGGKNKSWAFTLGYDF